MIFRREITELWSSRGTGMMARRAPSMRMRMVMLWGCEPSISWLPLLVSVRGRETFVSSGSCASSAAPC